MNGHDFTLAGETLTALGSGALWFGPQRLLCVSDLHLGKSERTARRGGRLLPPYEMTDTLARLEADIAAADPAVVVCLGDSFDDLASAEALPDTVVEWLRRLQAGRSWIWIAGNHDPTPIDLGGTHRDELKVGPLTFRHIADPCARHDISGHYHPKAALNVRGRLISRPCFLHDATRLILPAYGTYTGGLRWTDKALQNLMDGDARAILTGPTPRPFPMPRAACRA